jgi:hypothetical protein
VLTFAVRSSILLSTVVAAAFLAACGDDPAAPMGGAGTSSTAGSAGAAGGGASGATAGGGIGGTAAGTAGAGGSGGTTAGSGGSGGSGGAVNLMPTLLSETGLFTDAKMYADPNVKAVAADVHPFTPKYTLWSDSATKSRYVYMPPGGKIVSDEMEYWRYPAGFKLWKDFSRDGKLIETRLLLKKSDGFTDWYMVSFKWKDDYSDAVAIPDGEMNSMGTQHDIPTKEACLGCHGSMSDNALGFTAFMLSTDVPGSLTLAQISTMGWLTTPPTSTTFSFPGTDEVAKKALGYMHANCGMCHNTKSQVYKTKVALDLWTHLDKLQDVKTMPAYLSMVCDQWVEADKFNPIAACEAGHATGALMATDISKPKRVTPKAPTDSGIRDLMALRATGMVGEMKQMPPIGTEMADTAGLADVDAWINSLPTQ